MASEAAERPLSLSPEQEAFDTTVDPSYIIQLIRQLLPSSYFKDFVKQTSGKTGNDIADSTVVEVKDLKERTLEQQVDNSSSSMGALVDMDRCRKDSENVFGGKQSVSIEPLQRISGAIEESQPSLNERDPLLQGQSGGIEKSQPSSNETGPLLQGQSIEALASNEEDETNLGCPGVSDEQREEAGCMLWDLAATQSHAEFMVQNHILDVLLAILGVPHSDRLREICLGIMGNLACHAEPVKAIVQTSGLPAEIVQSLFVDDAPSLSEVCRLLSASLHSEQADSWIKFITSREVLERVMWITSNTMNSLLLEKSSELLLAMVDCEGSPASVLSALVHLGLPAVLTDLLASEISAFNEGMCSHGNIVLDTLLQIAEALSLADDVAGQLAHNLKLFTLACQVIQLSEKDEVGPAAISAAVLVANLLAEKEDLIHEVTKDVVLIKQLLELLPAASDDPGARNALWSILGRVSLAHVAALKKDATGASTEVSLAFANGSNILLEDLQDHQDLEDPEDEESAKGYTVKLETVSFFVYGSAHQLNISWFSLKFVYLDSFQISNILLLVEGWLTVNESKEGNSDTHKTLAGTRSALKEWLRVKELDEKSKHKGDCLLPNGTND